HEARLDDAGQRRRVARANLDRALDVAGGDLRAKERHELFLVDDGAEQEQGALDQDRHRDHEQREDGPHAPAAFVETIGENLENGHPEPPSVLRIAAIRIGRASWPERCRKPPRPSNVGRASSTCGARSFRPSFTRVSNWTALAICPDRGIWPRLSELRNS